MAQCGAGVNALELEIKIKSFGFHLLHFHSPALHSLLLLLCLEGEIES